VLLVAVAVGAIALVGDVRTTWTFSACTVLLYYSVTNLAALRLGADVRRYPRALAVAGLAACLFLTAWIPGRIWLTAAVILALGFALRAVGRRYWLERPAPR